MTRMTSPPPSDPLPARVAAFLAHLEGRRELPPPLHPSRAAGVSTATVQEALERLEIEHEELSVAEEKLRVQLDSMVASERARTDERLSYREVFDFAPDPLFITNRSGLLLEANFAALLMLGGDIATLEGKPLVSLLDRPDWSDFLDALDRIGGARSIDLSVALRPGRGAPGRVHLRGALMRNGARILWSTRAVGVAPAHKGDAQVEVLGRKLFEQAESLRRSQGQVADLTRQLQEAREAQRDAESRLDARGRAVATLGHELRGPLSIVNGWAQLLRRGGVGTEAHDTGLAVIVRQNALQEALIGELLDASAFESGQAVLHFDGIDACVLARETVEATRPLAVERGLEITCETEGSLTLLGDPLRLAQALTNLLTNAFKFTPPGGRVDIRCGRVARGEGRDSVRITVEDSGEGSRPEEAEAIFGFFARGAEGQRHSRSLGLGLYLMREFVTLHGGTVTAERSGAEGGTRFTILLPALTTAAV